METFGVMNYIKQLYRSVVQRRVFAAKLGLKIDRLVSCRRLGSEYGGWTIIESLLREGSVAYCFGVGQDITFDLELVDGLGVEVHAFDPTPGVVRWIQDQQLPEHFHFHPIGLAGHDGEVMLYPPNNPNFVSYSILNGDNKADRSSGILAPVKRLASILDELGHSQIDLLKMDIEGSEYQVLEDMATSSLRPTQLLVEYHHRFPEIGNHRTMGSVSMLRELGYELFAFSDRCEELSFVHKRAL